MLNVGLIQPPFVNNRGGLVLILVLVLPCNPVEVAIVIGVSDLAVLKGFFYLSYGLLKFTLRRTVLVYPVLVLPALALPST